MCFHNNALTVGITKNGEMSNKRTKPRPGKGSSMSRAMAKPNTTVMAITLPSNNRVLTTATLKEDDREVDRHHQWNNHPQK